MWQERFGILKNPLERAFQYVFDIANWSSSDETEFYYTKFPEFKLVLDSKETSNRRLEHWMDFENPCEIAFTTIKIFYHTTQLKVLNGINLDYKIYFPNPRYYDLNNVRIDGRAYIIRNNAETCINAIVSGTQKIEEYDSAFVKEQNLKSEIDAYITDLKLQIMIYGLKIEIEEENINQHYSYRDRL
ncbi:hypothetical protein CH371_20145 [Leptospira wolffii]|uniref:Uncharacterized protein n=1 Tax=Leptospira wolffii TaxID=409998 RepID=A0A2M9Z6Q6_9LEPT|nr:hypothetical protein [Leptospira wolffii]PJZ64057.1 hypothetical protein CH371_20145 [Leptospira wolffii]